ncbi:MAG: DNA-directed RNA polymerase subunit P [Nanoarchaeota archaeon]|nr:DNA-directed RNA polymerase subunit P [Nanoarchaeota archaeon]
MYKCMSCGKEIETRLDEARKVQCPYCGYRILEVTRPPIVKRVQSD